MPWSGWRLKNRAAAAEDPRWEINCGHPHRVSERGVNQVARRGRAPHDSSSSSGRSCGESDIRVINGARGNMSEHFARSLSHTAAKPRALDRVKQGAGRSRDL